MRMSVVSPRLIDPLTRLLQYLYAAPVLLLLLFVTVQAQYWLHFVHGVAGGVSQALDTPGVVPIGVSLVVASAAFHELGHAAALRYGGGKVRGMGVGLYLVYPAFYTDVTDNYRLGRWGRVGLPQRHSARVSPRPIVNRRSARPRTGSSKSTICASALAAATRSPVACACATSASFC